MSTHHSMHLGKGYKVAFHKSKGTLWAQISDGEGNTIVVFGSWNKLAKVFSEPMVVQDHDAELARVAEDLHYDEGS